MKKNSMVPLYQQLAEEIRQKITEGKLKPGEKMMTEAEFSQAFNVSRITVRKAIDQLVEEECVVRKQGLGTFVAEKKLHRIMKNQVVSFTEMSELSGRVPSSELVSVSWIKADTSICKYLNTELHARVLKIVRIRKNDALPVMIEESYFPESMAFLLEEDLTGSTYQIFREHGLIPSHGTKTFAICQATAEEAAWLEVSKNQALLLQKDVVTDQNGNILHYSKVIINSQRYQLTIIT